MTLWGTGVPWCRFLPILAIPSRAGRIFALTLIASVCGGCLCWFVPCDRFNHVSGHVRAATGDPIEGAEVEFYGVTH